MNRKHEQRGQRTSNVGVGGAYQHKFNYESEGEQKKKLESKIGTISPKSRVFSETRTDGPPKYMMNTVNADLKRGQGPQNATVVKTKQLVGQAEKKFKEDHTFKPQINEFNLPPSKEVSKEDRWKKLTEPKTVG